MWLHALFAFFFFFSFSFLLHLFIYFPPFLFLLLIILFNGCHEWMLSPCYQAQTTLSSCYHPIHAQATLSPCYFVLHHAIQAQTTLSPCYFIPHWHIDGQPIGEAFGVCESTEMDFFSSILLSIQYCDSDGQYSENILHLLLLEFRKHPNIALFS